MRNIKSMVDEFLRAYEKGKSKSEIKEECNLTENEYAYLLNVTRNDRRLRKTIRRRINPPQGYYPVLELAKQGYAIGEIAEALHLTLDECRKKYHEEREQRERERAAKSKA